VVRLLLRFVLALLAAAVSCAGLALAADAATIVSGPISSNTTWTPAGSPYLLNGNVTVAAGVTLTIQPGVVVKLNGTTRYLQVNGTLSAIGSAASPITFTSIQDDSIAGDSGGDGPTTGAPGQWYDIRISSGNGASLLKFVEVRYGGWGTIYNYGYGALSVSGSSTVTVEDAAFRNNQRSGIKVGPGAAAVVRRTTLSNNGNGISVSDGRLELSDRSVVSSNAQDGVWFSFASNFTGPASSLKDSDVTVNGRYGVYIQASGFSGSLLPSGSGNNISLNATRQLYTHVDWNYANPPDWNGNFWGASVYFWFAPATCGGAAPNAAGHLADRSSVIQPPEGPIRSFTYLALPLTWCAYDMFRIDPAGLLPWPPAGGAVPPGQALGDCEGKDARNPCGQQKRPGEQRHGQLRPLCHRLEAARNRFAVRVHPLLQLARLDLGAARSRLDAQLRVLVDGEGERRRSGCATSRGSGSTS
jgi:hypothetical protein